MPKTKEEIFAEWEGRNKRDSQQNTKEEIESTVDQIDTWLSHLEVDGTERSETFKLQRDDKEAIQDYLQYIRELVAKL